MQNYTLTSKQMSYFEDFENNIVFGDNKLREIEYKLLSKTSQKFKELQVGSIEDPNLLRLSKQGIYLPNKGSVKYIHKMTIEEIQKLIKLLKNSHPTSKYKGRKEYYLPLLEEELKKRNLKIKRY